MGVDKSAREQCAEVPSGSCFNMVRLHWSGHINGMQFCSPKNGFESTDRTIECYPWFGQANGDQGIDTDYIPRFAWNGKNACLKSAEIYFCYSLCVSTQSSRELINSW